MESSRRYRGPIPVVNAPVKPNSESDVKVPSKSALGGMIAAKRGNKNPFAAEFAAFVSVEYFSKTRIIKILKVNLFHNRLAKANLTRSVSNFFSRSTTHQPNPSPSTSNPQQQSTMSLASHYSNTKKKRSNHPFQRIYETSHVLIFVSSMTEKSMKIFQHWNERERFRNLDLINSLYQRLHRNKRNKMKLYEWD